jgi:outer membrane protein OmpA-like peptidoglycan-associated protein
MKQNLILLSLTTCLCFNTFAQHTNTLYFMQGIPERNTYNPAFQSPYDFYIDLPIMPSFNLSAGNNSVILTDVFLKKRVQEKDSTMTFLHPLAKAERDNFYKSLRHTTRASADASINLLGFGFRRDKNYFTFNITQKVDADVFIPKALFNFALHGPGKTEAANFDLRKLGVNASAYMEIGMGYSRQINDRLTIGGKLKYLIGEANVSTNIKKLTLNAGEKQWALDGFGSLNISLPNNYDTKSLFKQAPKHPGKEILDFTQVDDMLYYADPIEDTKIGDLFSNYGFGVDLGATYKLLPELQLSAAITDLGFIRWNNNPVNTGISESYTFEGIDFDLSNSNIDSIVNRSTNELNKLIGLFARDTASAGKSYTTSLSTRFNLGAEYSILNDKIGFGLLSSMLFVHKSLYTDLTVSANFRPCYWFHPTISYSVLDGRFNTIGFGAQIKIGVVNMYLAVDKIPFTFASTRYYSTRYYIPSRITGTNVQVGMVWTFGDSRSWKNKDDDSDGVKNRKDKCPYTPVGYWVDKYGCPGDDDGDGVLNDIDQCPDTPAGAPVDEFGCLLDTDGDGVFDYLDKCPNTVKDIIVDADGCPLDTDGDGVPDYLDKCPNTPAEACEFVDEDGCPKDTDEDGIPDYLDKCPTVKGVPENNGCPVLKEAVKRVFEKALQGIQFEFGKDVIQTTSFPVLDQVITIMKENPEYLLTINGHTDNVGEPAFNRILSENRANSVQNYLIKGGVDSSRLTAKGYGDTQPVVENTTNVNRAKNRRVEFVVKFEKIEQE